MKHSSDPNDRDPSLRDKIIGLGERSIRKSYYPQLVRQLDETEKSQARYRTLVENINEVIFSLDAAGTITYVSPVVQRFGAQPKEVIGRSFLDFVHPDDRAAQREGFERVLSGVNEPHEFRLVSPDGSLRHVRTSSRPVIEDGRTVGLTGAMMDITERKEAEASLLRLNQELRTAEEEIRRNNLQLERRVAERTAQLEAANHELEAFSYSVSHDLRAPLRAIAGYAGLLKEDYDDKIDDEGRRMLGAVQDRALQMEQLIDDILKFSRAGTAELATTDIDMEKLVREVLEELLPRDSKTRVAVGSLPPARGDRAMLRQVFVNLLSNAIKFSRSSAAPEITVSGSVAGDEAVYSVKDNGVGFDAAYADKLFGVFQRLHAASAFEGTGIGLAIIKRIVVRHGGRVWAEGRPGAGATFGFALPRGQAQ
jgi:PAS domain S-box-containing protein